MSTVPESHRQQAPRALRCAVLTVSDTRTLETDRGGQAVVEHLERGGHEIVARALVPDEPQALRETLGRWLTELDPHAILLTGGTGIGSRDLTWETLAELYTKTLPGYGELFRMLSYQEIGPAAMLSRATGGLVGSAVVLTMPGSPAAVKLAMEKLILPELGHLVQQARS
jgi:molybdenum cofactor biosynthesis protein B